MATVERQKRALSEVEALLYSDDASALDRIASAQSALNGLAALSPEAEPWVSALESTRIELDELVRTLTRHARDLKESPVRLEEVADRIEAIKRLCRKHGGTLEAVLERRDAMRAELDGFERQAERLDELAKVCARLGQEALDLAEALSKVRRRAAGDFARAVEAELKKLAMDKTTFEVALTPHSSDAGTSLVEGKRIDGRGLETGEFLLAPNRGEAIKPLARIASGGELSRLMLAIKRVLAKLDPVFTYVFDEVDTGMSGAAADAVGRLLEEVSRERQVIVVTHLPQIAAFGSRHFTVEKEEGGDRVRARVKALSEEARTREIARMLAGSEVLPAALENARAMLAACRQSASH
ncbi:MAG: hypothetical protein LBM75_02350 [Myxococcales bacterium]|nr:hypothetical protein [Myxococcales bacterium]